VTGIGSVQANDKKIGLLHSLIRKDEKMLLDAFKRANVTPVMIDDRKLIMDFETTVLPQSTVPRSTGSPTPPVVPWQVNAK